MDNKYTGYEIAIIGMAGQFPGAENVQAFWDNLKNGVESIRHFSREELLEAGVDSSLIDDPNYVPANAFLEGKEYFDAAFFDYRPDEAKLMDPQMRVLHQCVWAAVEDAGYNIQTYKGRIALFAGASSDNNWQNYATLVNSRFLTDDYFADFLTNVQYANSKISYLFNLRGPSVFLNTACSTSLVAVHQACNSLLLGECTIALAGAVSVRNFSTRGYMHREGLILSADGHCRTFDAAASGTVGGEGVGIVVLKRLKNALADNDNILAVIKGTGINNDGSNKVGYTAPGIDGQVEAIIMARKMAKVEADSITYIEAHGTGTRLGDPVEVEALNRVFGNSDNKYCALGSVKTNIGHLDVAAGVAGLIKVVLSLKHKQIPPSLHFNNPNPQINFSNTPFYVNTTLKEWRHPTYPLRAGISSFGIGGTNVHLVVEEAPAPQVADLSKEPAYYLLPLSAKTPTALETSTSNLQAFLQTNKELSLADIAYTLQTGRGVFRHRKMIVCSSHNDAINQLSAKKTASGIAIPAEEVKPLVAFMFSGQGAQYINMCRDVYAQEPVFKEALDECFQIYKSKTDQDLKQVIFPEPAMEAATGINETALTQPALFVVEYALARLLMCWGIQPDIMIGHSLGEYVAACISGAMSLADALNLVIKRGQLMQKMPRGAMLGITISEDELNAFLATRPGISLAAVNSPALSVVSGDIHTITEFADVMEAIGFKTRKIHTSHAFHSYLMDGMLDEFEDEVKKINIQPGKIPIISNLTGNTLKDTEITNPKYWRNHLRETVRFSSGLNVLLKENQVACIEVGPGKVLSTFVRSHSQKKKGHTVVNLVRSAQDIDNDFRYLLNTIGELWTHGVEPNWQSFHLHSKRQRVSLPTYAFDKVAFQADVDVYKILSGMMQNNQPVKNPNITEWFYAPSWKLLPLHTSATAAQEGDCTLIFADDCGIGHLLTEKFKEKNEKIIYVKIGESFQEIASQLYELDPHQPSGYQQLFTALTAYGLLPTRVINCWGITKKQVADFTATACEVFFYSLLETAKLYQAQRGIAQKKLIVLTNGLHPVLDEEEISGIKSMSLGLLKIVAQEFPAIKTSHVDISLQDLDAGMHERLYQEISANDNGKVISLRHQRRWIQTFESIDPLPVTAMSSFRQEGVYLITGGLGALGYALSRHLLKTLNAKVVLLGRTELARPETGLQELHPDKSVEQKLAKLQVLQKEGGEVLYLSCDISDKTSFAEAVAIAEQQFGPINGVVHAAGIVHGNAVQPLLELEWKDFDAQFLPKVTGVQVLKEVLEHKPIDFCIVTSSLAAVLGGLGFGAYAPSNIFMDYYIDSHKRQGQLANWISLNLDGLNFDGANANIINEDELWEVINKALTLKGLSSVAVSATDLQPRLRKWVYRQDITADTGELPTEEYVSPSTSIEEKLAQIWATVLEIEKDEISITSSFFELGGNSLIAPVLLSELNEAFDITASLKYLYQYPTIETFSAWLAEHKQVAVNE